MIRVDQEAAGPEVSDNFSCLVYPFECQASTEGGKHNFARWKSRWRPWWQDRPDEPSSRAGAQGNDDVTTLLDDTYFFLPHIRRMLMPETAKLPKANPSQQLSAFLNHLAQESIESPTIPVSDSVRLRMKKEVRNEFSQLTLTQAATEPGKQPFTVNIRIAEIELWFFPPRLGFLTLHCQVETAAGSKLSARDLREALSHLRWIHGANSTWILPEWSLRGSKITDCCSFRSQDFVNFLLQESFPVDDSEPMSLVNYLSHHSPRRDRLDGAADRATESEFGQTHAQTFLLFTWAALQPSPLPEGIEQGIFANIHEKWLWELAHFSDSSLPEGRPHSQGLERWRKSELYAEWQNWQGSISSRHVVFLGVEPDAWMTQSFPTIVRHDYYPLYILAIMQRARLHQILPETQAGQHRPTGNLEEMQHLWDEFVAFENKFWFTEVTGKPQGERLYHLFQETLGVKILYDELRRQIGDIKGLFEQRFEKKMNRLLRFIAYIGVPLGLLGDMYGTKLAAIDPFVRIGLPSPGTFLVGLFSDPLSHLEAARGLSWLLSFVLLALIAVLCLRWFPVQLLQLRSRRGRNH